MGMWWNSSKAAGTTMEEDIYKARTISTGGNMASPRAYFNLATISRGGGETTFAIAGYSGSEYLNSVEEWEEESSTWKAAGNLDTARSSFGVVTIPKNIICPT